jgi:hypothetical protein
MLYLQGGCFDPPRELDVSPFDLTLNIHWPVLEGVSKYFMSDKDVKAPNLVYIQNFKQVLKGFDKPLRRILIFGASGQVGGALIKPSVSNVLGRAALSIRLRCCNSTCKMLQENLNWLEIYLCLTDPKLSASVLVGLE